MHQPRLIVKKARIRAATHRSLGCIRLRRRRVRFAIHLLPKCQRIVAGVSTAPARHVVTASELLHGAYGELDALLARLPWVRDDCKADVHEAIGLITESLRLLATVHAGLNRSERSVSLSGASELAPSVTISRC